MSRTTTKSHILLILLAAFTYLAAAQLEPITQIKLGDEKIYSLKKDQVAYYKFRVDSGPDMSLDTNNAKHIPMAAKHDLTVVAYPHGDCDPEIFISTENHTPNTRQNAQYFSTSYGYASVFVPAAQITVNRDYFVGIRCATEFCDYSLIVDYASEYYMRPFIAKTMINFNKAAGAVIAHVNVAENAKASHIVIATELLNIYQVEHELEVYAKVGNNIPTPDDYDLKADYAWHNGKALYVYKGDKHFCTNCNYTLAIQAPKHARIRLSRTVYGDVIESHLGLLRNDAVEANRQVTYAVDISKFTPSKDDIENFIMIEGYPYFGTIEIYANIGSQPKDVKDYEYAMTEHAQQTLEIYLREKPRNNILYITVVGKTHSTFGLRTYQTRDNRNFLTLGEPQMGKVADKEVRNFLLFATGTKGMELKLNLQHHKGRSNLVVRSCTNKNDCHFNSAEVEKVLNGTIKTSIRHPILQFSNAIDGDETITIKMDGSTCNAHTKFGNPRCMFVVGVYGNSSDDKKASQFTLTATRSGFHLPLRVNLPVKRHVPLDHYHYFTFLVSNDTGMESVNFQLTKLTGDVEVFVSRTNRYPDVNDHDNVHHYNDLYSIEKKNDSSLNGLYFIAIKAITSSTYSIMPVVRYNAETKDAAGKHIFVITEGIPQKSVLDNTNSAYFKFRAMYDENNRDGIQIQLSEVQGNFIICARKDGELPAPAHCQYQSNTNTLTIPKSDMDTKDPSNFVVGVFPNVLPSPKPHVVTVTPRAHSFTITWTGIHGFRLIPFGFPVGGVARNNVTAFYQFQVHPYEDKEVVINLNINGITTSSKAYLHLANLQTKLFNKVSFHADKSTANTTSNQIRLTESDIVSLCDEKNAKTERTQCLLYLAVTSEETHNIMFSVSLAKDYDDLRLVEGLESFNDFPSHDHPIHLYYYPQGHEDIAIFGHSFSRNMTMYANVIDTTKHSLRRNWEVPTKEKHWYKAIQSQSNKGEHRLSIPAYDLAQCSDVDGKFRCAVSISIYYGKEVPQNNDMGPFYHWKMDLFSVIATQEITPIPIGRPVHSSVNENTYKYFDVYISKEHATIMASVNVLSGKHAVVMATKGKDARPTLSTGQFKSYYGKQESLIVTAEETEGGTTEGHWVIAVYGFNKCEFVLTVVDEKSKVIELRKGLPVTNDIIDDPVYYQYYHESAYDFLFKITKERGAGTLALKAYKGDENISGNLPTKTKADVTRNFESTQEIVEILRSSALHCSDCIYVLGIFPATEIKVSLVVQSPNEFIYLGDSTIFTDYSANTIINRYEHLAFSTEQIDINVIVYSGEPHIYVAHTPVVNTSYYTWSHTGVAPRNLIRMKLDNTPYADTYLEPVWDGHNNVSSYSGIYYVYVTSPIPSKYSIAISVSNSTRTLIDGSADFGFLNPNEYNLYKHHVSRDEADRNESYRLKLQVTLHRDTFTGYLNDYFSEPQLLVMPIPNDKPFEVPLDKKTHTPRLPVIEPIRKDVLERTYGDSFYTLNVQYNVRPDQDFYILFNNSNPNNHLNYSITANSREPVSLTMNHLYSSRVATGDSDLYAVHTNMEGLIVVEIHNCMGKVMVETSPSRNYFKTNKKPNPYGNPFGAKPDPEAEVDDESFTGRAKKALQRHTQSQANMLPSQMGSYLQLVSDHVEADQTIYIRVTAIDGVEDDDKFKDLDAVYKIRVNVFPAKTSSNFLPFLSLEAGHDGVLEWNNLDEGSIKLGFGDVKNLGFGQPIKSTKFGDLSINYHYELFLTRDPEAGNYLAKCDMIPKAEGHFKNLDRFQRKVYFDDSVITTEGVDTKVIQVSDIEPDFHKLFATLRVTAIGVDQKGQHVWDYPIIYKTTEIRDVHGKGTYTFILFLLGMSLLLLTLALLGLVYYYEKFKRVKAKLNYEMQDLRGVTAVQSFEHFDDSLGPKKGYAGLIEEEA